MESGYYRELFPGGKVRGRELRVGDIYGGPGSSFGLNVASGQWADFASVDQRGGDYISLVAHRENISQTEALKKLEEYFGLSPGPLPPKPGKARPKAPAQGPPTKSWVYTDPGGRELYRSLRWEKPGHVKACRLKMGDGPVEKVPLYLPEVLAAIRRGEPVFITEGEPKADRLKSWGLTATTFAGGVRGYRPEMGKWFAGAGLVIVVDSDQPGREFGLKLAEDLYPLADRGLKLLELPGARFAGYDLIDWIEDGGGPAGLAALVDRAPAYKPAGPKARPLQADPARYSGLKDLEYEPVAYDWLLEGSLRRGQLGLICGPPGCGKGLFSLQLAVALAAGRPAFDFWSGPRPARVLYISAEDDETILHNRLHHALGQLPAAERRAAAARLARIPVRGRVNICRGDKSSGLAATDNLEDLRRLAEAFQPDLMILDTLARFFGVDENDNPAVTAACGLLEEIIGERGCNILLVHHASKSGGDLAADRRKLDSALTQTAIRGASALAGCVRWALMMAPLSSELAGKIIGPEAAEKPGGAYVAARVAKKNAGRGEAVCYLERQAHGLLKRVRPRREEGEKGAVLKDAAQLVAEAERRARAGEAPLTAANGGRQVFGWSYARSKKAAEAALAGGLLTRHKREGGRGHLLRPAAPADC